MDDFKPCRFRQRLIQFEADGSRIPIYRCAGQAAEKFGQDVTPPDCDMCGVRREEAQKTVHQIALSPAVKQDTGGDGFCPCVDRLVNVVKACCGNTIRQRVCGSAESYYAGAEVTPVICAQCPVRRFAT